MSGSPLIECLESQRRAMKPCYSREEVLRLAPDASSAKSGQDLAHARKWLSIAADEAALWGECQGSGAKPYQVQVDLAELASKCSCPSRKFPCKHAIGLLLISATAPESVAAAPRPDWVNEWHAARRARAAKAAEKPARVTTPRDPDAAAKRRTDRWDRIRAGMTELSAWTQDLVRFGIAAAPTKGFDFFDGQARRLIDAQAPGAARLVQRLGSRASQGDAWQRPFLERLALLYLLTMAVERCESLSSSQRADIDAALGIPVNTDDLAARPTLRDAWQVVSREVEFEDGLSTQRSWLFGCSTRRVALVLNFAHGAAPLDASLQLGQQFDADLTFYPGGGPRAALPASLPAGQRIERLAGCENFAEMLDRYATALAQCPWIDRLGFPLLNVVPTRSNDAWHLIDAAGAALPLGTSGSAAYILLAVSGGAPLDVAAEFDGRGLRPLSVASCGTWIPLVSQSREAA